jgi:hypothetical protein
VFSLEEYFMTVKFRFNVTGVCEQEIELVKDCPLTVEQITAGLNGDGDTVVTTVQEGGDLVMYQPDGKEVILGKVIDSTMDAEYTEFELQ